MSLRCDVTCSAEGATHRGEEEEGIMQRLGSMGLLHGLLQNYVAGRKVCVRVFFSLKFVIAEGSGRLIDCCAPAAGSKNRL